MFRHHVTQLLAVDTSKYDPMPVTRIAPINPKPRLGLGKVVGENSQDDAETESP